ncbi:protein PHYTOCHROME KINASE SUBSTRATE 1 [Rhodamnia argentea]|uniref:Protein PHYTOCHROME KINASE SUBSTRATE 1 n=1 Tax=Rhodamnia argentea TaxID=178133 RepID=A0A8B8QA18_9MYRT|nr:protein PHYTOCHROME KINASE SUBSTRATE 1 [Rhodamnia argentea]
MAMITLTPSFNPNHPQTYSLEDSTSNNNSVRDASFPLYLNNTEESFIHKLAQTSGQSLNFKKFHQEEHLYKEEDGEIGVFGAEKYFNGAIYEEGEETPRIAKMGSGNSQSRSQYGKKEDLQPHVMTQPVKPKLQSATPSVRSESSWNSQNALLQRILRNPSQRRANKTNNGKSFLASLGCKCSCSGKSSVDVDDRVGEISLGTNTTSSALQVKPSNKMPTLDPWMTEEMQKKENLFTPSSLKQEPVNLPVIKTHFQEEEELKPKKSLEVFGSPVFDKRKNSYTLEKRLAMLTWDSTNAIPRKEGLSEASASSDGAGAGAGAGAYNSVDCESDASSDLFEIESLTGKVNSYFTRQVSDATSDCITPTTRYAPSEASIEWSVVTASAADVSAMSDYSEAPATSPLRTALTANRTGRGRSDVPGWRRSGILLGCKSQKAVRVAGDGYRTSDKSPRTQRRSDESAQAAKFRAEARLMGLESKNRQHTDTTACLVPGSHVPSGPKLLYMQ